MNALVLYGSNYGNTQKIAEIIAEELDAQAANAVNTNNSELANLDLLIVGSPINGWQPLESVKQFLEKLHPNQLKGIQVATFDTRVKLFIHGDAMKKFATSLQAAGAVLITDPKAFYVTGPQANPQLLDGEIEKAKIWAQTIKSKLQTEP